MDKRKGADGFIESLVDTNFPYNEISLWFCFIFESYNFPPPFSFFWNLKNITLRKKKKKKRNNIIIQQKADLGDCLSGNRGCAVQWKCPLCCSREALVHPFLLHSFVYAGSGSLFLLLPQIKDHHTHIIGTVPCQSQLSQQNWSIRASTVGAVRRHITTRRPWRRWRCLRLQAHLHHPTSSFVWHHIPQSITCQYQTLVVITSIRHSHLGHRNHERLQIVVSWTKASNTTIRT